MTREKQKSLAAKILSEGSEEWHLKEKNIIYTALREKFGEEVDEIIEKTIGNRSKEMWREVAHQTKTDSLDDFLAFMFDPLPALGWEFERKDQDGKACFRITKCPKAELAKRLGTEKMMFLLACATDIYCVKGFNEKMEFSRTKTLVEGHDCCDHTFWIRS